MISPLTTKTAVDNAVRVLLHSHKKIKVNSWQGMNMEAKMFELTNIFIQMKMCKTVEQLSQETKADLPWSENHFQERIANDPEARNPGREWKNWPYYQHKEDDNRFRTDGLFSHTYQERYFPEEGNGRFPNGTLDDVIARLEKDHTTRQAYFSIWQPQDQSNFGQRVPCTLGYWFKVNGNKLDITYLIRSCDATRHFRNDVYMTQRLVQYVAEKLNLQVGTMTMWIGSFHCFATDVYALEKKLK